MDTKDPLEGEAPPPERAQEVALRFGQLLLGLFAFGFAISLYIRSGLGLGPWDAFHYGLHLRTGLSVGSASILAGAVILTITMATGLRPGIGTVLNMVLIGGFTDLLLLVIPAPSGLAVAVAYFAAALLLTGVGSGMYIGAGFGHGPRDGLMVALANRTDWSIRRIRTLIEAIALALGWLMGGKIGVGTVVIMLAVGPSVQWGLGLFGALPQRSEPPLPDSLSSPRPRSAA